MDALVDSLVGLLGRWNTVAHMQASDGTKFEDPAVLGCAYELRQVLEKHRVGAWA